MAEERTFGAGLLHDKIDPRTGLPTVGLFQDPDGSSWVREPDYTETRLPSAGGGGGPPTGAAGGALAGIYPNPDLAAALAGAGLSFLANVVSVNVDGTTVEVVGDVVGVKDGGITPVKLSFDPATQAELDALAAVVAALDANVVKDGDAAGGDLTGTYPNPTLVAIGAATGPIGNGTTVPVVTIDAKGRITALTSAAITGAPPTGTAGGDLDGTYPNPTLDVIVAAAGPLGSATTTPVVTIDAKGRVTALTSATITGTPPGGAAGGVLSGTYPNPGFNVDMATQAELDTAIATAVRVADFDAKGDVLIGTANDAFDQQAVGTDDTTLVASAAAATGWKSDYARAAGPYGGLAYKAGHWYSADMYGPTANVLPTEARLYAVPFRVRRRTTFDRISLFQQANGTAGALIRAGLYADDGACYPGARIVDAGTVAATAGSPVQRDFTINQQLEPGIVWIVAVVQGAAATRPQLLSAATTATVGPNVALATTVRINDLAYFQAGVSGALGTPFTTTPANTNTPPWMWLRAA